MLEQRISSVISTLVKKVSDNRFDFLQALVFIREYAVCWEILIELMCEREDKLLIDLFQQKEEIIAIAKELNLEESYIRYVKSRGLHRITSLTLDLTDVNEIDKMHEILVKTFGFPNFCGKSANSYIDCLRSLRYPDDEMLNCYLEIDDVLDLTLKTENMNKSLLQGLLEVFEAVNYTYSEMDLIKPINVILTQKH